MIDPVGTVHASCVLGLEDEKRRFFSPRKLPARLLCEDFETTREYWLPRRSLSRPSCFPALGDAQSRWNQPGRPIIVAACEHTTGTVMREHVHEGEEVLDGGLSAHLRCPESRCAWSSHSEQQLSAQLAPLLHLVGSSSQSHCPGDLLYLSFLRGLPD